MRSLNALLIATLSAAAPAAAFAGGHGEFLDCTADSMSIEIERGANFCYVDGTEVEFVQEEPSFVCNIPGAEPQVMTIMADLSFTLEGAGDTVSGMCEPR